MATPSLGNEFLVASTSSAEAETREALDRLLVGSAEPLRDRVVLLLTELLPTQGLHAPGEDATFAVKVLVDPATIRVEVRDGSSTTVGASDAPRPGVFAWTPHLLNRLADRWGLVSGEAGAWGWFELDVPLQEVR